MVQVKWQCCSGVKVVQFRIRSPEGDQFIQVCETHRQLTYFKKYLIAEDKIEDL